MTVKTIEFFADPTTWRYPNTIPTELVMMNQVQSFNGHIEVDLESILLHIAFRTRPPRSYGFSLGDMWAWMRYYPAFLGSSVLRLREEWQSIDPHQKTIMSDDFGTGFASYILTESLGLSFICPTNFFIDNIPPGRARLIRTGTRGPNKSPDFVAIDRYLNLYIFECKGTQNQREDIYEQFIKGRVQKDNLIFIPSSLVSERLVTGLFVPQFNSFEQAYFLIEDPEPLTGIEINGLTKEKIAKIIIRGELASSLHIIGLTTLANIIALGQEITPVCIEETQKQIRYLEHKVIIKNKYSQFVSARHVFNMESQDETSKDKVYSIEVKAGFDMSVIEKILFSKDYDEYIEALIQSELGSASITKSEKITYLESALGLYIEIKVIDSL